LSLSTFQDVLQITNRLRVIASMEVWGANHFHDREKEFYLECRAKQWGKDPMDFKIMRSHVIFRQMREAEGGS
jgi:hypothetical protein